MASKVDAAHVVRLGWHLTRCRWRIAGRVFEQAEGLTGLRKHLVNLVGHRGGPSLLEIIKLGLREPLIRLCPRRAVRAAVTARVRVGGLVGGKPLELALARWASSPKESVTVQRNRNSGHDRQITPNYRRNNAPPPRRSTGVRAPVVRQSAPETAGFSRTQPEEIWLYRLFSALHCGVCSAWRAVWVETPVMVRLHSAASKAPANRGFSRCGSKFLSTAADISSSRPRPICLPSRSIWHRSPA